MTCTPSNEWLNDLASAKSWNGGDQILVLRYLREMRAELGKTRGALIDIGTQVGSLLSDKVSNEFLCLVKDEVRSHLAKLRAELDAAHIEAAQARDALAKATTPAPEREAAIERWAHWALRVSIDRPESTVNLSDYTAQKSNVGTPDERFVMMREEIDAAVALMRSAGDPDAKLRDLRAAAEQNLRRTSPKSTDAEIAVAGWFIRRIDEMLAKPAPVEQPAADCKAMLRFSVEHRDYGAILFCEQRPNAWIWNFGHGDEMKWAAEGVCRELNKLASPPPAAAVPDDTRELVAQLADLVAWSMPTMNHHKGVKTIASKARGGK